MELSSLKIRSEGIDFRQTKVWLNGEEVKGVRSIKFEGDYDSANTIIIELLCDEVDIDTKAIALMA